MATETRTEEALLPYEWPGSYYIGEEEIEAVNKVLRARSPYLPPHLRQVGASGG